MNSIDWNESRSVGEISELAIYYISILTLSFFLSFEQKIVQSTRQSTRVRSTRNRTCAYWVLLLHVLFVSLSFLSKFDFFLFYNIIIKLILLLDVRIRYCS
jgi:hypothetical protein